MDTLIEFYNSLDRDLVITVGFVLVVLFCVIYFIGIIRSKKTPDGKKTRSLLLIYINTFIGLVVLVIGTVLAARTIHLYISGVEITGTITGVYQEIRRKNPRMETRKKKCFHNENGRARCAAVRYKTGQGNDVEVILPVKYYTRLQAGDPARVIYLPGDPERAAIRGEFVLSVVYIPVILLIVGSMFFGVGAGIWATQLENKWVKKHMENVSGMLILATMAVLVALSVVIPVIVIYEYVRPVYYWVVKSMGEQQPSDKNIYSPLVAAGIEVKKPHYDSPEDACNPWMKHYRLDRNSASSGDRIQMQGVWGEFTSDKVALLRGRNYVRRLRVIEWTPETITVEIPDRLNDGTYRVGVTCYMDSTHTRTRPSGFKDIEID